MLIALVATLVIGCGMPPNFAMLSMGMDKQAVLDKIGSPDHITAFSGYEFFTYERECDIRGQNCHNYVVKFDNNRVVQYGSVEELGYSRPSGNVQIQNNWRQK
jgi:hypothetical protein